jgi:hypothetical protein
MPAATSAEVKLVRLINPATGVILDYAGRWLRPGRATATDVRKGQARFAGDKVWLSLPPGVQKQLDAGHLQVYVEYRAREEVGDSGPPGSLMPRGNASHAAWADFAVAQGMDREDAAGLTRDQIRARFAEPALTEEAAAEAGADGRYEVLA